MKLVFESPEAIPSVSDALSMLTSGAEICLGDIHYDETKRIVEIFMRRKEVKGFKKSFFGRIIPLYSQLLVESVMTIKEITKMNIEVDNRLITECDSCFTVLLGMTIDGNDIYFGSAEESQGKTLCEVFISVNKINIECIDK